MNKVHPSAFWNKGAGPAGAGIRVGWLVLRKAGTAGNGAWGQVGCCGVGRWGNERGIGKVEKLEAVWVWSDGFVGTPSM